MTRMRAPRFQYTRVESAEARATVERVMLDNKTEAFLPMFYKNRTRIDAGAFTTASDAALAHDLLTIAAANEAGMELTSLKLHTDASWIQGQPYYLFIQTATCDRVAQLLRTEPSTFGLVSPSMKLAHPPQQAVIPIHIPLPLRDSKTNYSKTAPPTVACSSTVLKDPKSPDQQRCKVRTNWATFPEKSANQSVVLTRFQVQTGNISMPIARCHAVLGAFSSSCSVHLKDTETDKVIKVGYKVYPSQPTQIFLQGFKAFFAQQNAQAGDVLTLSPLHPEVKGQASITRWPATHPQAQAFRQFIRNGWSINSISVEVSRAGGEDTQPKRARKPRAATVDEDSSSVEYGSDLLYHLSSSPPTQHKSQAKAKQRCEERSEERICREEEELLVHFQKRAQLPPAVHRRFKKPSRQTKKTPQAKTNYRRQGSTLAPRRMKIGDENQSETEHFRCEASSSKGQSPAPSELRQSKTLRTTRHGHRIRKVRKDTVIENVIEGGRRRKSDLPHRSSFGERSSLESTLVSALRNLDTNKNR